MITPKIYISTATKNIDGTFTVNNDKEDILQTFPSAKYNELDGMNAYGKPKIYTEQYAEESSQDVFFQTETLYETTDFNLKLYMIDEQSGGSDTARISAVIAQYHSLMERLAGKYIRLEDNIRKRKMMLVLADEVKPAKEQLYGIVYMSVTFKFKNIFGRSFDISDNTSFT